MRPIIDSHLDLAWNALGWDRDQTRSVVDINAAEAGLEDERARGNATTSLVEMRRGGVAVCLATILARQRSVPRQASGVPRGCLDSDAAAMTHAVGRSHLAYYEALERAGHLRLLRTADELRAHWQLVLNSSEPESSEPASSERASSERASSEPGLPLGVVISMEGADPIVEPEEAALWWDLGLRCTSLVHYGTNRYAVGTGERGPLTPAGVQLLDEFDRLGMILDVTHLSDPGFFQALEVFSGPVLASHSNCRALVPDERQFSDEQLRLLIARGAVIGAVLDAWMLHPGWKIGETNRTVVSLAAVADHIDHVCQLAGNARHAAIGSDLDGGFGREQVPTGLETIADLQKLDAILAGRGYSTADIDAIFHGNWLRFLEEHLP